MVIRNYIGSFYDRLGDPMIGVIIPLTGFTFMFRIIREAPFLSFSTINGQRVFLPTEAWLERWR